MRWDDCALYAVRRHVSTKLVVFASSYSCAACGAFGTLERCCIAGTRLDGTLGRIAASQVDRESRILSDAYPYIASRLLTDSAPELQSALQQLLFKDGKPR